MNSFKLQRACGFTRETFRETLEGGQAFRWKMLGPTTAEGIWGTHHVELQWRETGEIEARAFSNTTEADLDVYLDLVTDYDALIDQLPWRSDPVLDHLRRNWRSIRLLRQPLGETLLAFLCSSTKQIVQIKAMMSELARRFGEPLPSGRVFSLPTWERLSSVPEEELRGCALGYRARYVAGVAARLNEDPEFLQRIPRLPYAEAKTLLKTLPGVGDKVADCVLLFGDSRWEAFPVDTWISKFMIRHYQLEGWSPRDIGHFSRIHFGRSAGLVQQWMFAEARRT